MVNLEKKIFELIYDNNQRNSLFSPFWIYNVEELFVKGKHYIKVYIIRNNENVKNIQSIYFQLLFGDITEEMECFEFHPVTSINNENAMGCILEISEDYAKVFNEILVKSYRTINEEVVIDGPQTVISLNKVQTEVKKNEYLYGSIAKYRYFPNIAETFWQCICGAINKPTDNQCYNCTSELSEVKTFYKLGLDDLFLEKYFVENKIDFNPKKSIQNNIDALNSRLKIYDITEEQVLSNINFDEVYKTYERAHPIKIDFKKSAEENIDYHYKLLDDLGLKKSNIDSKIFDHVEIEITSHSNKRKKSVKTMKIVAAIIVAIVITTFTLPYARYAMALNNLKNERYEKAENTFTSLDGLLNATEYAKEAKYQGAIQLSETDYLTASKMLSDLTGYKESSDLMLEYKYLGAIELSSEDLLKASNLLFEIGFYKDAKDKILEYKYEYIMELYEKKEYEKASKHLAQVKNYKDIDEINDAIYANLGERQVAEKNIKKAIELFGKMNNQTKYNETSYNYATSLYNKKDLSGARSVFYTIKEYKDSKSKISAIERILFKWEVDLWINNSGYGSSHDSNVSLYSTTPIYFHTKVANGHPGKTVKLRYVVNWPNGSTDYEETYSLSIGETYWQSWQWDNIYNVPRGKITFKVYNAVTGEHLGTQTSNMR